MKKKLLIALAVFAGLILIFVVVVALQPANYRIERSRAIHQVPERVFAEVNDFHRWEAWSPWAKLDPNAKNSYLGADAGAGAVFHWSGNDDVGEGSMTILESRSPAAIRIKLDFVQPMEDTCFVDFAFAPAADGTQVTWTMTGEKNFVAKAFCMFMDMDQMVGGDFERGLANLEQAVGTRPAVPPPAPSGGSPTPAAP